MKKIYIWKVIRKIQGFWICYLFSCLTILKWRNSSKCIYGLLWIQIWNLNLQFFCNAFLLNGISNTSAPNTFHFNTLSCACALHPYWLLLFCTCMISVEVEPEQEIIPEAEDTQFDPPQQGKQTPLIMSIKSQFPLILAYACLGWYMIRSSA